jgi:tetratricopeptide (TPR) repeat protein
MPATPRETHAPGGLRRITSWAATGDRDAPAVATTGAHMGRVRNNKGDSAARRGLMAVGGRNHEEAIRNLEEALGLGASEHESGQLYALLAMEYDLVGKPEMALQAGKKAVELSPSSHHAWHNLGVAHAQLGNSDEAIDCYSKAIELRPDFAGAYSSLGAQYVRLEEPLKAIPSLQKAIELDRTHGVAHSNLAMAYAMLGEHDKATASLRTAIAFGYKNWRDLDERIEALREFDRSHGSPVSPSPADSIQ